MRRPLEQDRTLTIRMSEQFLNRLKQYAESKNQSLANFIREQLTILLTEPIEFRYANNAEKRDSVLRLLSDPEWVLWSNKKIARQVGVSETLVANIRKELPATESEGYMMVQRGKSSYKMKR